LKRMIFHSPVPLNPAGNSGSDVRPVEMLKAFKELGYDVLEITGYGLERKVAYKKLRENLAMGFRYEFLYSETSTMPMFLTEKHHFPLYFYVEILLFRLCRLHSIPITTFYRDIYWKFNLFQKGTSYLKRTVAYFFYHLELITLSKYTSILFLPSLEMRCAIPYSFEHTKIYELPPGISTDLINYPKLKEDSGKSINLIYVGGVIPPLYDLSNAIKFIGPIPNVNLTVICRREEWDTIRTQLPLPVNIKVKHISGKDLETEYLKADLSLIVLGSHPYRRFCMPLKLFEAIGYNTPVLMLSSMNAASNFVKQHDLGYIINSEAELAHVFNNIIKSRIDLHSKINNIRSYKNFTTWTARANEVNKIVTRNKV